MINALLALPAALVLAACPPGPKPGPTPPPSTSPVATSDWYAWIDRMPPGPPSLHVTGTVQLPTPGHDVALSPVPSTPDTLLLQLTVTDKPGIWPQVITPAAARFDQRDYAGAYTRVIVREPDGDQTELAIEETH